MKNDLDINVFIENNTVGIEFDVDFYHEDLHKLALQNLHSIIVELLPDIKVKLREADEYQREYLSNSMGDIKSLLE